MDWGKGWPQLKDWHSSEKKTLDHGEIFIKTVLCWFDKDHCLDSESSQICKKIKVGLTPNYRINKKTFQKAAS